MRRLVKSSKYIPNIGDLVVLKNSPNDKLAYEVISIGDNGNICIQNDSGSYSNIKPSTVKKITIGVE